MNTSIPLICLTYILVLLFIFYSKKQKINLEIKYFLYLSFINIVGLVIEVISFTLVDVFNSKPVFSLDIPNNELNNIPDIGVINIKAIIK
jgi:hypothetical protein